MATRRYFVGGPSSSGKSTFVIGLVEHLRQARGCTAETFELDVWSNSYPAFEGKVPFNRREKRFDLAWDWQGRVQERLDAFYASSADVAFGDLPGKLGDAVEFMCWDARRKIDGAIVVSKSLEGLDAWSDLFRRHGIPIIARCLSFLDNPPFILVGMNRNPNPQHPDVERFGAFLVEREIRGLDCFAETFRKNIAARSRTAKGVSDTSSSTKKRRLLKEGKELERQVAENTEKLIMSVWEARSIERTPEAIRHLFEGWCDIVNAELQTSDFYRETQELLTKEAEELRNRTGLPYRINPWYRTWELSYASFQLKPVELELAMDHFYRELHERIAMACRGEIAQEELCAWVDYTIDSAIHPWFDGCARLATAAVMWLSLLMPHYTLPVFKDRDEHYASIGNVNDHIAYYRRCLGKR